MINNAINYIELPSQDFVATQAFYSRVFGWTFTPYGDEYLAFHDKAIEGGFYKSELQSNTASGAALIVFYSTNIEALQDKIQSAGGAIIKPIFAFPGGRRFHFTDLHGNELAAWSDKA
ncbi:MAG: VOC family protein [bacterium]|nr:VOC family protein [bacterium]